MLRSPLASLGLLAAVLATADVAYSSWARAILGQAVREGSRFAITGRSLDDMGHQESIRKVLRASSFGLLDGEKDSQIEVSYSATDSNTILLHLKVRAARRTPLAMILGSSYPIDLSASCVDVVERVGVPSDPPRPPERHLARLAHGTT